MQTLLDVVFKKYFDFLEHDILSRDAGNTFKVSALQLWKRKKSKARLALDLFFYIRDIHLAGFDNFVVRLMHPDEWNGFPHLNPS